MSYHRHPYAARTMRSKTLSRAERRSAALVVYPDVERPRTRGECGEQRPCPFVSCRHHLYLDVTAAGTVKLNFPHLEVDELEETCSLDVADRGGATHHDISRLINLTRSRVQQVEAETLWRLANGRITR